MATLSHRVNFEEKSIGKCVYIPVYSEIKLFMAGYLFVYVMHPC